jgi:putative hemolysin
VNSRLDDETIKLISLVGLSILTALFSVAEMLLSRLDRDNILNITEAGGKRYELLTSLLHHTQRYSVTIITAKSALIVTIVVLLTSLDYFDSPRSQIIGGLLAAVLIVVVTELIPKNYVRGSSENSTIHALRILRVVYWILYPVTKPLSLLTSLGVRILGGTVQPEQDTLVSPEVLDALDKVGDSQEILKADEREMISRIFDLPDKIAREIMIPRTDDMVCLEVSTPRDEVLKTAIESRHSRIPVYQETVDRIIGILYVKELLDYWAEGKPIDLQALIADRTPFFTPESKKIWELFQDLRANKQHMAIVVDEYGGTAGLVTLEDIIEEVVGEIQDEYDFDEQEECVQLSENLYSIDARMNLDELNERLGTQIESESVDTIGGFVVNHLGKVPEQESQFSYQGIEFTILEADERRIHRIQIQISAVTDKASGSLES